MDFHDVIVRNIAIMSIIINYTFNTVNVITFNDHQAAACSKS